MPRALLHIGHPKTATTFLQHLMQLNAPVLADAGYRVPSDFLAVGDHDYAHLACLGAVYPGNAAPFFLRLRKGQALEPLDACVEGPGDLLLSSELFFYWPSLVERLANHLSRGGRQVDVIAYVDRYDWAAVKAYSQNIRNHGFAGTLLEFLEAQVSHDRLLRYHEVHARLGACEAIAAVEFRAFPARYLAGGCIEQDFFGRLAPRLDVRAFRRPPAPVNVTPSLAELEALRRLNAAGHTEAARRLAARKRSVGDDERNRIRRCYFTREARDFLVRELSEDARRFSAVMPPEQADLWRVETLPVEPLEPDASEVESVLASAG